MQEYTGFPKFSRPNSEFSREISVKFFSFHENQGSTFSRIPGNFGHPHPLKIQEYTGFPEFSTQNSDFSREIFTKIWNFHDILGSPVTKFPGILVEKTPENTEIYGFHRFCGVKFGFFPGILVDPSTRLEKCRYTPGVRLQEYTGFPVPPGAHFGP